MDSYRSGTKVDILLNSSKSLLDQSINDLCMTKYKHFNVGINDTVFWKRMGVKAKVICLHTKDSFALQVENRIIHGVRLTDIDIYKGELLGYSVGDMIYDKRWQGWANIKRLDIASKAFVLEYTSGLYAGKQVYVWSGYPGRFD